MSYLIKPESDIIWKRHIDKLTGLHADVNKRPAVTYEPVFPASQ